MKAYASYSDYTELYLSGRLAVITPADFPFFAMKASREIKKYTFDNIDEGAMRDEVVMCCCEIAEQLFANETHALKADHKVSESVGGWSVSYESKEQARLALQEEIRGSIYRWLAGTGLLYGGIKC